MYHCRIQFYLTGHKNSVFEIIKAMPPLEHFTHEFIESEGPREDMAANADVILADVQNAGISTQAAIFRIRLTASASARAGRVQG